MLARSAVAAKALPSTSFTTRCRSSSGELIFGSKFVPMNSDCQTSVNSNANAEQGDLFVETLGCKVNLFESEYIRHQIQRQDSNISGNVCIINTCTVTKEAARQSRQAIRKAIRNNPDASIVVTGCYAEMEPDRCADISGVDLVVPGSKKLQIPELVASNFDRGVFQSVISGQSQLPVEAIPQFGSRNRAFVQIQQGCDNGCTFCIIHKARGKSRSILPTTIFNQVARFIDNGTQEIVLCGIDLGSYGFDFSGSQKMKVDLADLVRELAERYKNCRFRLSSIDPAHISKELVHAMVDCENICPHIHLSLQSAAPLILKRMKRRYTNEDAYRVVDLLRKALPDLVLSADIMAGFPTESDDDFALTEKAIEDLEIAYPHVFPYSDRDGTPAARIPKQVPLEVKTERARRLREAGHLVRNTVLNRYVGQKVSALVESKSSTGNHFRARMANYLPVYIADEGRLEPDWMHVRLDGLAQDGLLGVAAP